MTFDETGTLTVESGADHPDVLEFMKANAPEQVFTTKMKYKLLAGEEVEIFDMPPRGHPGRFGDKERARVRVRIEGPIMTLLEERGSNRLTKVTDTPFLGTWVVESAEALGQKAPDEHAGGMKLTFHPDKATWHFRRPDGWKSFDGTLWCDPASEPKEIDLSQPNNPGKVALGIYKIEGNTLTISMGAERPKTFEEPSWAKMVFRREE